MVSKFLLTETSNHYSLTEQMYARLLVTIYSTNVLYYGKESKLTL